MSKKVECETTVSVNMNMEGTGQGTHSAPKPLQLCRRLASCCAAHHFWLRTVVSLVLAMGALSLNSLTIAWIHERVPRNTTPLPDLWFAVFPEVTWAQKIAEILMGVLTVTAMIVILVEKQRWRYLRRYLVITTICYTIRAICISVIQVPPPSTKTYCAPPSSNFNIWVFLDRFFGLAISFGTELYRKRELCGDLIVSGHTLQITIAACFCSRYGPKKLRLIPCTMAFIAMCSILMARKHYTIDVLAACYIAHTVFNQWHTVATFNDLGKPSPLYIPLHSWFDVDDTLKENAAYFDNLGVAY